MLIELYRHGAATRKVKLITSRDLKRMQCVPVDINLLVSGNQKTGRAAIQKKIEVLEKRGLLRRKYLEVHLSPAQLKKGVFTKELGALFERQPSSPALDGIVLTVDPVKIK